MTQLEISRGNVTPRHKYQPRSDHDKTIRRELATSRIDYRKHMPWLNKGENGR